MNKNRMKFTSQKVIEKLETIKQAMGDDVLSSREIQERTGLNENSVRKYIRNLADSKQIHIAGSRQVFAVFVPLYAVGAFSKRPLLYEETPTKRLHYPPKIPTQRGTDWVTNWIPVRAVA